MAMHQEIVKELIWFRAFVAGRPEHEKPAWANDFVFWLDELLRGMDQATRTTSLKINSFSFPLDQTSLCNKSAAFAWLLHETWSQRVPRIHELAYSSRNSSCSLSITDHSGSQLSTCKTYVSRRWTMDLRIPQ